MVEFVFEKFVAYCFPSVVSDIVRATDKLASQQDPPYSHGNYFVEIRREFLSQSWVHKVFFNDMSEPIFTLVCRYDYLYIDQNFAKFSTRRLDETYRTYSENLALRWPGYVLSQSGHIFNATDNLVCMD